MSHDAIIFFFFGVFQPISDEPELFYQTSDWQQSRRFFHERQMWNEPVSVISSFILIIILLLIRIWARLNWTAAQRAAPGGYLLPWCVWIGGSVEKLQKKAFVPLHFHLRLN